MLPPLIEHLPDDRRRLGITQVQMARTLGLSLADYKKLESG
jgi:predicted transcriptional regulator